MKQYDELAASLAEYQALHAKVQEAIAPTDFDKDAKQRALSFLYGEICRTEFKLDELRNVMWLLEGPGSLKTDAKE